MKTFLFSALILNILIANAQTAFGPQYDLIVGGTDRGAFSVVAVDLDDDGDQDVISAAYLDGEISWYENINGTGTFEDQQIITENVYRIESVFAADIDGDGDYDLLSASTEDWKIAWYENTDGNGTFSSQKIITTSANGACCVYAEDIDGDGDMDVITASKLDDTIAWYENTDGNGSFGTINIVADDFNYPVSVCVSDIDGDGDNDIVAAGYYDSVIWYENTDGNGSFTAEYVVLSGGNSTNCVVLDDLDGDDDQDILIAFQDDDQIAWFENTDGEGSFGAIKIISADTNLPRFVYSADLDNDGDKDVLSASEFDYKIAWYENLDGNANFGDQQIISTDARAAKAVIASDLNNDGDLDVISASFQDSKIAWYENTNGNGVFGSQQMITNCADRPETVYATDLDNDGDIDILSASADDDKIAWYENADGYGTFSEQHIISTSESGAQSVFTADIDNDGDQDVLSGSLYEDDIHWFENTQADASNFEKHIITADLNSLDCVYATDIDNDGDFDVFAVSGIGDEITWYENLDGNGTFGAKQVISSELDWPMYVSSADIDGDGDQDVLTASSYDDKIGWFENTDGEGTFGAQQIISDITLGAWTVHAADIDNDGDMDVLSSSNYEYDLVAWYENTDGNGNFGPIQIIYSTGIGIWSVYTADFDDDGDTDVVAAKSNEILWFENTDGNGTFSSEQYVTSNVDYARCVYVEDIDGDNDIDIISASWNDDRVAWYQNQKYSGIIKYNNSNNSNISIYPNPTASSFYINSENNVIRYIMINNMEGKSILEKEINSKKTEIDITHFKQGIYFISLFTDFETEVYKIVKE